MDQTKNSKPVAQASFTTRLSAGFDRALNSKTKWADKVNKNNFCCLCKLNLTFS